MIKRLNRKGRGRKDPSLLLRMRDLSSRMNRHDTKREIRYVFSKDGVFSGDGDFRWWQEYDDSGYGWDGHFDIISKAQLIERIRAASALNVPVYEKVDYGGCEEYEMYDLFGTVSEHKELGA